MIVADSDAYAYRKRPTSRLFFVSGRSVRLLTTESFVIGLFFCSQTFSSRFSGSGVSTALAFAGCWFVIVVAVVVAGGSSLLLSHIRTPPSDAGVRCNRHATPCGTRDLSSYESPLPHVATFSFPASNTAGLKVREITSRYLRSGPTTQ